MRAVVFDYGAGNLHSLAKALQLAGAEVGFETDPARACDGDLLVLPGVGAFGAAAERLRAGLEPMRAALLAGLPALGICLGMQLLFERSEEGAGEGLGILGGSVERLRSVHVPQMGWNEVADSTDPVIADSGLQYAYYANGYVCRADDASEVVAWSEHEGDRFAAAVRSSRARQVLGVQFHPEKSSRAGVRLLQTFLESVRR